jgi:predicted ATPase with chaperone activity
VAKYQKRISGPLLDQIDIHVEGHGLNTKNNKSHDWASYPS